MSSLMRWSCVTLLSASLASAQNQPPHPSRPAAHEALRPAAAEARPDAAEKSAKLPVRRVVLYKNGIGYFEHFGRVHGNQDVQIDFTSAQLNDVLKSLTVLDLSGGRITSVEYNSEAPLARRLATLRLALGENPTVAEFLRAVRGTRLEVRPAGGAAVSGRLLSVERKTRTGTNWAVETDEISLVTDSGEVRTVDLNPTTVLRIAEKDLQMEIGKYLGLIASARDQDVRRMTITTAGAGDRNLYVSYISEVPIWKTTYRIVLPDKAGKKPLLQGWAIVDNTVGEDWNNVELSLVAGAPHSFIQQLSEPYYGRRPVVAMPENVSSSPQTHGAMLIGGKGQLTGVVTDQSGATIANATVRLLDENNAVVAQTNTDSAGNYIFSSLPEGTYRAEMAQLGFKTNRIERVTVTPGANQLNSVLNVGAVSETVAVTAESPEVNTTSASLSSSASIPVARRPHVANNYGNRLMGGVPGGAIGGAAGGVIASSGDIAAGRLASGTAASGEALGDLFEYKLKDLVTLKKNRSALVPIVHTEIEAEKISVWSGTSSSGRPLRGLWMKNSSALTLDGGSFSVLEGEVFAGEGLLDPVKPGERRVLSYATDLSTLVEAKKNIEPQRVTLVKIAKGVLTQSSKLHERTLYTARNQDGAPRVLIIEHPARTGWELSKSAPKPEESAAGLYRFRLEVPARASATLAIEEYHPLQSSYQISSLTPDQVAVFAAQKTLTADMERALRLVIAQQGEVAQLEEKMGELQEDIDRIVADQSRLRENLKALKGSAEEKALVQRYTKQLDEQETRIESLRKEIQETEAKRDAKHAELEKLIDSLQFEAEP